MLNLVGFCPFTVVSATSEGDCTIILCQDVGEFLGGALNVEIARPTLVQITLLMSLRVASVSTPHFRGQPDCFKLWVAR
jgi:hypothetical protein